MVTITQDVGVGMHIKAERRSVATVYNTGKVKIGLHYVKPLQRLEVSRDMEILQIALLKFKLQFRRS